MNVNVSMSHVLLFVIFFLTFVIGFTSATCTEAQLTACLSDVNEIWPSCNLTEIDTFCSRTAAARQCLANISCSGGDVGYTEVKGFGNFSKYTLMVNELDAIEILCDARQVLINQTASCVFVNLTTIDSSDSELRLFPAVDLNHVSWIGDHCGFLRFYYEQKYATYRRVFNDAVGLVVFNATLKLYELQQLKCPPYAGDRNRSDHLTVNACLSPVVLAQSQCESDKLCSEVNKADTCITNLNLSIWDAGYLDASPVGRYLSRLHSWHSIYLEGALFACGNLPVLKSSCLWIDALNNFTESMENQPDEFGNITTYEDVCSYMEKNSEYFYTIVRQNGYSENVSRILQTCFKKYQSYTGCFQNDAPYTVPITTVVPVNNRSPPGVACVLQLILLATVSAVFATGY